MKPTSKLLIAALFIFITHFAFATWITHPSADLTKHNVFLFRKTFNLEEVPQNFTIEVSADPRYRLYVNGTPVCFGPAKGDVKHWRYETIDIAQYLVADKNCLAVWVYNRGSDNPVAQPSAKSAFYLKGQTETESFVNTDNSWKVTINNAFEPITANEMEWWNWAAGWYALGSTHRINGKDYPWGWENTDFDDSSWSTAKELTIAQSPWELEPRPIPFLEEKTVYFKKIARTNNVTVSDDFLNGSQSVTIPANTTATILFDMGELVIGYPELVVSKGDGSQLKVTYNEALFISKEKKDNRNRIDGMFIDGYWDIFNPGGGTNRLYRPLWFRTFRYVQFDIQTGDEELVLNSYKAVFTAYPFKLNATIDLNSSVVDTFMNIGWRTARLCAAETYFDCPYYEQLNYGGDTRVQAFSSLYLSGDERLMKDAIRHLFNSTTSQGITKACYPMKASSNIMIPTYSLYTISMLYDLFMQRDDSLFLAQYIPNIRSILDWFDGFLNQDNLLENVQHWNFVDWAFNHGTPPGVEDESNNVSSILTLHFAYTLDHAADLMDYFSLPDDADAYRNKAQELKNAVITMCYDSEKQLIADTPQKNSFSQHANILGILTDAVPEVEQQELMQRIINNNEIVEALPYYKFYFFRALTKTGLGDQFMDLLEPWQKQVDYGLTTFTEEGDLTGDRSDCHAWTAHPMYYFFYTICGIQPGAPHFKEVTIAPNPGEFKHINASIPHPEGEISVNLNFENDLVNGTINLPVNTPGQLKFAEQVVDLDPGTNIITLYTDAKEIPGNKLQKQFDFFPNPVQEQLWIITNGKLTTCEIYNTTGNMVHKFTSTDALNSTDVMHLTPGIYLLRIAQDNRILKAATFIKK